MEGITEQRIYRRDRREGTLIEILLRVLGVFCSEKKLKALTAESAESAENSLEKDL